MKYRKTIFLLSLQQKDEALELKKIQKDQEKNQTGKETLKNYRKFKNLVQPLSTTLLLALGEKTFK